jgi:hypothetical protein
MLPLIVGAAGAGLLGYGLKKTGIVHFGADTVSVHQSIFDHVLNYVKNPLQIKAMGQAFKAAGKNEQAEILLKRAAIGALPKAVKDARRGITAKVLSSKDPAVVHHFANLFEKQGCVGHAKTLREYGNALNQIVGKINLTKPKVSVVNDISKAIGI